MTTRLGSANEFCWMDLKSRDLPGTAEFFSRSLGWRFAVDEADWRKAVKITVGGHEIGGVSDLADPVYPPGTPAHIAFYLRVDDVDRRVDVATANGARMVVSPFDAGDQGRIATLIDPVGAAFSLWQPKQFTGWDFPPHQVGAPHRMILACEQPDAVRHFYRETTGAPLVCADFLALQASSPPVPQWELVIGVDDLDGVVARARDHGPGHVARLGETSGGVVRLRSPDGPALQVRRLGP